MFFDDTLERNAQRYPDTPALVCGDTRLTWSQLLQRTLRRAGFLRAHGIRKGDRVAYVSRNHPSAMECYLAAARLGAIVVPLNYRLTGAEWGQILRDCSPKIVFVQNDFIARYEDAKFDAPAFGIGDQNALPPEEAELEKAKPLTEIPDRSLDDLVSLIYTSGTTGQPKGVMHTHRNWFHAGISSCIEKGLSGESIVLNPAPLYHVGGGITMYGSLLYGTTMVLMEEFDPDHLPILIEKEQITHTLMVPAMIRFVLEGAEVKKRSFKSLKCIFYGASPIREQLLKEAIDVFKCDFMQGYGMTETIGPLTLLNIEDHKNPALLASCGRATIGVHLKIGAPGERGEIRARGECVMKGYWNRPEETREVIRDGWLHTGDIGVMDEKGYVTIVDRKKDMIISGGENIFPREVEQVLVQHPAVADCAVIGVPHDQWGEEVKAFVVLKDGKSLAANELIEWSRSRLAGYKRPRTIEITGFLPRTPTGKVLYRQLREPYWTGHSRRV